MENLVVRGERYTGFFKLDKRKTEVMTGWCEWRGAEEAVFYDGMGVILDSKTNKMYPFHLTTEPLTAYKSPNLPKYMKTAEGNMVFFKQVVARTLWKRYAERPSYMSPTKAVDMVLDKMVKKVEESANLYPELIPDVKTEAIELDELNKLLVS